MKQAEKFDKRKLNNKESENLKGVTFFNLFLSVHLHCTFTIRDKPYASSLWWKINYTIPPA